MLPGWDLMPVYYPSAQVRLQMYLDDYTNEEQLADKLRNASSKFGTGAPATQSGFLSAISENQSRRSAANRASSITSPSDTAAQLSFVDQQRANIQRANLSGQPVGVGKAGAFEGQGSERGVAFAVLPQQATIERNGIIDPSTGSVVLDFKDVPIDPRILRSCLVTITIGTVTSGDYRDGVVNRQTRTSDGLFTSIVERNAGEEVRFTGSQSRFVGMADEWLIDLSESGDTVEIRCRDISAIIKDQRLPKGVTIDLNLPLLDGIEDLFSRLDDDGKQLFPMLVGFPLFFGTPEDYAQQGTTGSTDRGPVPGETLPETAKTRGGRQSKAQKQGDHEDSLWDHIVTVCQKQGLIPFVRGFVLFIAKPQTLYEQVANGRKMVYGRNLTNLKFARKIGAVQADTIEVRSFDPDIDKTRWARHPVLAGEPTSGILNDPGSPQPKRSRPTKVSPIGQPDETVRVLSVPRITDLEVLESIAQQTFQEIARQEVEGSFSTDDLDSFKDPDDPNDDLPSADLLALEPGEPITILIAPPNTSAAQGDPFQQTEVQGKKTQTNAQDLFSQSAAARTDYLRGLGISSETAQRLAQAAEQIPLANTFKAAYVNINYDIDDGVSMEVSFYNYITVREEAGQQPSVGATSSSFTDAIKRL